MHVHSYNSRVTGHGRRMAKHGLRGDRAAYDRIIAEPLSEILDLHPVGPFGPRAVGEKRE